MKIVLLAIGVVGALLGGFWLLQGLGIVHIAPVLCVADCEPIEGQSPVWAAIGFVVLAIALVVIFYALKRRSINGKIDRIYNRIYRRETPR